jgi:TRAP-type C4-dicarboxylate transport system substrate-binding protein
LKLNAFEGAAICNFYHPGKIPAWMVFSLPFLPLGDPKVDKYVRSRMMEHPAIVADMEKWNAMPYVSGLLPQYEILGKGPAPTTLEGWNGLRVRAGGGLGTAMEKLGAVKQTLPAGETSTAFQRGALDAAAFPFTYAHVSFKISEEAEWFTSNLAPGTSECSWVLNKTSYENLPPQYQEILMENRDLVMDLEQAAYAEQDAKNLPEFEANMTKIVYSDEDLAQFKEIRANLSGTNGLPPTATNSTRRVCSMRFGNWLTKPSSNRSCFESLAAYLLRRKASLRLI